MASFVLITNCIAAIVIHSKYRPQDGVSTAFEGDCNFANQVSRGLHVLINVLSSLLLSASNYTMQVLNAPTRSECDKAHARGDWLDIGITSLRNIARITWYRRVLWLLSGFSSVPIHLFYNSAAFKTIDANEHAVVIATPLFLQSNTIPRPRPDATESERYYWQNGSETFQKAYHSHKLDFANLTNAECINIYAVDFVSGYSDEILVTSGRYPTKVSYLTMLISTPEVRQSNDPAYWWYDSLIQMTMPPLTHATQRRHSIP